MGNKKNKRHPNSRTKNSKILNEEKTSYWRFIFELIASIVAIFSILISIGTLTEMKIDRKVAYKPTLLFNPAQYEFSWDENGNSELFAISTPDEADTTYKYKEDGSITATLKIPVNIIGDGIQQFSIVNVGVGTAKDITFDWNSSNLEKLNTYLIEFDPSKKSFMSSNQSCVFSSNEKIVATSFPESTTLMYMLPEASKEYQLPLPSAYYILIQEIIKSNAYNEDFPPLLLTAKYRDIQNNVYTDVFLIKVKLILREEFPSGAGSATFQLVPLLESF